MTSPLSRQGLGSACWSAAACGLLILAALAGCAGRPNGGGGGGGGGREEALSEFDEPDGRRRARIRLELAVGYFEQGQTAVALDELKQVISADPNFADAYNLRGLVYMRMNDLRQAEESFRRALAIDPRDSNTQHNLAWLQCQQSKYDESIRTFDQALANPTYGARARSLMAKGLCEARAGRPEAAERSLQQSYELDAGNPVTGYNLANLLFQRGELTRAQFYIRRLNNTDLANAETLWLGIKVERRVNDRVAMTQLAGQLKRRFPQSREVTAYDRGAFDE